MAEKSLDRRAKMTRRILKHSLIELMREKPIHEISIKKICETADINRSTFYHHYNSQYELFDDIFNDLGSDIYKIAVKNIEKDDWLKIILTETFEYLEFHRKTVLVVLSENSHFSMGEKLTNFLERFFAFKATSVADSYCAQFISAGTISIVWRWLNNETRISAKDLAETIVSLIYTGIENNSVFTMK